MLNRSGAIIEAHRTSKAARNLQNLPTDSGTSVLINIRLNREAIACGIDAAQDLCSQSGVLALEKADERNRNLGS